MPPTHLLCLVLVVTLPAHGAGAAPWREWGAGMAAGSGYSASQLGSRDDIQGALLGPQRAKYEPKIGRSSRSLSEDLKGILKDLDKAAADMDHEEDPIREEAFQEEGSHVVLVPDENLRAVQPADVPGVGGKRNTNAAEPPNYQKLCAEGALAFLGPMLFGMVVLCVFQLWRKRNQRLAAAASEPSTSRSRTQN